MIVDVEVTAKCDDCDKTVAVNRLHCLCESCFEKRMLVELVDDAIDEVSGQDYHWKDEEIYEGFKTNEDKLIFMSGVKKGYNDALFWMADFFGRDDYFNQHIQERFYPIKKRVKDD